MFQTKVVGKIKTHFMVKNYFSPENRTVYEIIWKSIVTARQVTCDSMAHAHCMPNN